MMVYLDATYRHTKLLRWAATLYRYVMLGQASI